MLLRAKHVHFVCVSLFVKHRIFVVFKVDLFFDYIIFTPFAFLMICLSVLRTEYRYRFLEGSDGSAHHNGVFYVRLLSIIIQSFVIKLFYLNFRRQTDNHLWSRVTRYLSTYNCFGQCKIILSNHNEIDGSARLFKKPDNDVSVFVNVLERRYALCALIIL